MQTLPFMLGIAMIYLLYDKLTYTKISLGLVIAGIVMFTNTVGILFWPIMLLSFIKKENRNPKFLAIWVVGGILLSLLFVYGLNQSECDFGRCDNDMSDSFSQMFNSEKIYVYFLSLVSTIFRLKFNEFYIITGIILLSIFVTTFLYSIFNKKSTSYLIPWCQYGLMGLIFILLLSLGRFHLWSGESVQIDLYYITIINFLPISIIVLFYENLNMWKKNSTKNRKTIFNIILVVFFISLLVMFIPTYIIGWKIAEDSYNWKTTELSGCLLLPASTKHYETFEYCTEFHIPEYMMTHHTKNHQEFAPEIWNYFLKNDYNLSLIHI